MRAFALSLLLPLLLPAAAYADSLRCGSNLATEGSTQAEVLVKCGDPMTRTSRVETLSDETKTKDKSGSTSQVRTVTRTIDEWVYNFGSSEFMRLVTFVDGRLVYVKSLGYGTD
jgi:hypothetical protein